VFKGLR